MRRTAQPPQIHSLRGPTIPPDYERIARIARDEGRILRSVRAENLPSCKFMLDFMALNKPSVIGEDLTSEWRARKDWVQRSSSTSNSANCEYDERPNFDALSRLFGDAKVCIAHCSEKRFSDQKRSDMELKDFLNAWSTGSAEVKNIYVKDWHMPREYPSYEAYRVPAHFADDWMNLYASKHGSDDFRFVYMGPKGTWTPLHRDVFASYSWSSNILGFKLWIMFPPSVTKYLVDENGECVYDVAAAYREILAKGKRTKERGGGGAEDSDHHHRQDLDRFPRLEEAINECHVCIQRPGTTIYVPSGWYHQVYNLTDAISINHNWFNGWCLKHVWQHIKDELQAAHSTLAGFTFDSFQSLLQPQSQKSTTSTASSLSSSSRSTTRLEGPEPEAVQRLMKANTGIDCEGFLALLCFAVERKIKEHQRTEEALATTGQQKTTMTERGASISTNAITATSPELPNAATIATAGARLDAKEHEKKDDEGKRKKRKEGQEDDGKKHRFEIAATSSIDGSIFFSEANENEARMKAVNHALTQLQKVLLEVVEDWPKWLSIEGLQKAKAALKQVVCTAAS